ncbi:hypothetical protein PIB30_014503 [Stylosanthes scabra]|uniref:CRIB domain-containing protein n=1 Tax=Stylosanthes scabra TaxID=79078 RepID=A0ABU6X8F0_9FABA|nr:hypothetical protein [Stylosanthes scabra]
MKGFFKFFTQIFAVKEREVETEEMQIGQPTDVKHVAHIGWDGPTETGPSWMNGFKSAPDFSTSIGPRRDSNSTTPSSVQEGEEESQQTEVANVANKKPRRKKVKSSTSSPKSSSSSSTSKHSKPAKSKTKMQQHSQATD